jgi:hypothetical protein
VQQPKILYHKIISNKYMSLTTEELWFISIQDMGKKFFFSEASRLVLEPKQPPILWVMRTLSLGIKQPMHHADQSPPSSAHVKNG